MKLTFNGGYNIAPEKEPLFIWQQKQREASENISNICAKMKAEEIIEEIFEE